MSEFYTKEIYQTNDPEIKIVLEYFQEYPSRYTHSFDRISKKTGVSDEKIKIAKTLFSQKTAINKTVTQETVDFENYTVERVWVNNKGKTSYQLRPITEDNSIDATNYKYEWENTEFVVEESKHVLMVYLSDQHIGARVDSTSMLGNEYNADIFKKRMEKTAMEVIRLNNIYHFDRIIVLNLGDSVDGWDGTTGSKRVDLPQNMTNREVYQVFMDGHLMFFNLLSDHTDASVEFRTIGSSNHGGDFEWICFKSLADHLSNKGISSFIGNKFIEHFTINDHAFLISHGKDFKNMKFPMPKNLDWKTESYIKSYIDQIGITSKFIHFIKGDLHIANSDYGRFLRYKNCLSLFGGSEWQQTNFMNSTKGVSMDILNLTNNSVSEHNFFI